jgi:hypothetical protein
VLISGEVVRTARASWRTLARVWITVAVLVGSTVYVGFVFSAQMIAQHPSSTAALVIPRPPDGSGIPFEYRYEVAGRDYIASFKKGGDPSRWPRIGERRTLVYASNSPQTWCICDPNANLRDDWFSLFAISTFLASGLTWAAALAMTLRRLGLYPFVPQV